MQDTDKTLGTGTSGSGPGKFVDWKGLVNVATLGIRKGQGHLLLTFEEGRGGSGRRQLAGASDHYHISKICNRCAW